MAPTVAPPRGRQPAPQTTHSVGLPVHGAPAPRGADGLDQLGRGRFGKMFGDEVAVPRRLTDHAIDELARLTRGGAAADGKMPAGYTYLGQFIDHDITFDPTPVSEKLRDGQARVSFRTPRLDLDSLYGSGPLDQPYLYESDGEYRGVKLLVGAATRGDGELFAVDDLPRNQCGRALVGDPRNDENIIISQLHLLFIRFHNKVVDHLRSNGLTGGDLFRAARQSVCWHYQWIVVDDFLRRWVVGEEMIDSVLGARHFFQPGGDPFIPFEFSAAAYRFGHSLVRETYALNDDKRHVELFSQSAQRPSSGRHLAGLRPVPPALVIDWSFFFAVSPTRSPQKARAIDRNLASPLRMLPAPPGEARRELAKLTLQRARSLELPSGQAVATAMMNTIDAGDPTRPARQLTDAELGIDGLFEPLKSTLRDATPLWFYILCEANTFAGGLALGPVGGRIVAEVLVELLKSDPHSYFNAAPAGWKPDLVPGGQFTMADLVTFAEPLHPGPPAPP